MNNVREKIKKGVTIAALFGTGLVTAVLLYLPVRRAVREAGKKNISLMEENQEGLVRDNELDLAEAGKSNLFDDQRINEIASGNQESLYQEQWDVVLSVKAEGNIVPVNIWGDKETAYFFMPAYAKESTKEGNEAKEPVITLDSCLSGGTLVINNKEIKEGDGIQEILYEHLYSLQIYDKNKNLVEETNVIFLAAKNLPTVSINTESGSMEFIEEVKGNEESGQIIIYDEDGYLLYEGDLSRIKGRGNSTWGLSKKPYQIGFKEKVDLFGFGKASSYNLLANGYDETGIRNLLAAELADTLSLDYSPEGIIVSLYCNGDYRGNYYLCEKVQVGEERVNIRNQQEEFDRLYQGVTLDKIETKVSEDGMRKWADISYQPTDLTGGYLIERELYERYEVETISGFCTDQLDYYVIQNPEYSTEQQVKYIAGLMQNVQDAIETTDGIHPESGMHYTEYIDIDSFVSKYLVEEFSKNYDGGVTSSFFYKPSDTVSTKLFAGPIWDYDIAFGNSNLDEIYSNPMGITKMADHIYGTQLFAQLYEKEDFKQLVIKKYKESVLPWAKEMANGGIDEYGEYYRASMQMNNIRWKDLHNRFEYYTTYEHNLRYLTYFIRERMNYLNEVWIDGLTYHSITLVADDYSWKKIFVADGDCAGLLPVPNKEGAVFAGWYKLENPVLYDEHKPVYEDMTFNARWQELAVAEK